MELFALRPQKDCNGLRIPALGSFAHGSPSHEPSLCNLGSVSLARRGTTVVRGLAFRFMVPLLRFYE